MGVYCDAVSKQKGNPLIRTLICEDARLLREGLAALLSQATDIEVVQQLHGSDQLVQMAMLEQADVAVVDIDMPGSLAALAMLRAVLPGCRIVALFAEAGPGVAAEPATAHADGLVLKTASAEFMLAAVRQVAAGHRVVDPEFARRAPPAAAESPLTPREADVLQEAAAGISTAEIARRLGLSCGTVRNYISRAIAKTGARNRLHAIRIADQRGWLQRSTN
jgi:two-component system response regulator DesR